ncbi:MAG TPA: exodeoxyribonuclease VII large subunit [Caldilineae bacterium]|nr:exodeoxyribonuclease VII large subunit [Caldilineae bacterium]HIQ12732.1 exodeoxyribonuclease VII large subunit [Caldilineales bacterium]
MTLFDTPAALTVTQLAEHITQLVRTDLILSDVTVVGEISNFVRAKSGHLYFSLKDEGTAIACVMWRSRAATLYELPQNGQRVIASGHIDFYPPRGNLQFIVRAMRPEGGVGELYQRFEALKRQLQAEGLFDEARKRPLPPLPRRIAVVTSATGAALRDILRVLRSRWPLADVLVVPSLVQGAEAPPAIIAALFALYQRDDIDVIILARGGGSIEDLWAFNDEGVARMVAESPVPVVTGVGHETDFTIVDFVADHRAPTPSAAAVAVTPDMMAFRRLLDAYESRLTELIVGEIEGRRRDVAHLQNVLKGFAPLYRIDQQRLQVDELSRRLSMAMRHRLDSERMVVKGWAQRLSALNPKAVLSRGYALVQDEEGRVIDSVTKTRPGQRLRITVADGAFPARTDH